MPGIPAHYHIDRIEESLHMHVLIKRRLQIRHDAVPHEHHSFVGKINQHGIMRLTPSNWDQLEFRSADVRVRSTVDRNVRFVAHNIFGPESLYEELFPEDVRPVEFLFELLLIVASPIKLGTRVQAAEVRMIAAMIPVSGSNEHGCQRRQPRRKGQQRFVCAFCEIRARARVDTNEWTPILGNDEVVFSEFEAGQRVDTTGNDLGNAPRRERMTGSSVFRKRRCQCDRVIEVRITAATEIFLCLSLVTSAESEFAEMIVDFAQPSKMRGLVGMLNTPGEFLLCGRSLVKVAWKLRTHDTGDPVHDEDLAARQLLCLV